MASKEVLALIDQAATEGWIELDLSGMDLNVLPPEIGQLNKLETLILGKWDKGQKGNNLETLPDEISQLANLTTLNLSYNQIKEIPVRIAQLANLKTLDLSSNQIKEIPQAIAQLANLISLNLGRNQIKEISEAITQLTNLTSLCLFNNQIKEIPQVIAQLTNLTSLSLFNNQIKEIPEAIAQLTNLTELFLWDNQIKEIPQAIAKLSNLTSLHLDDNQIKEIPEVIAQLTNLIDLDLRFNQIKEIPQAIAQLTNLASLHLGDNQIKEIPEAIAQLKNLTTLSLGGNQIKEIPQAIAQLKNLTSLDLIFNEITEIPETIAQLSDLKELNLYNNQITKIPEFLESLVNLEKLDIRKNPLPISPEVLGSGEFWEDPGSIADIFNYLRQLKSGEVRPLNEAKLILIGQGSVGKTSLIKRLINDTYNPNEPQTDGLNVENWQIHVNSKDIRLNVWDFGGQEIYHATHQFFLTKRSLYLLVCNCRTSEEENRIEYWLKLIQTFGDASPVIIVGNKKDEQPFDINRKALREKYPNIQAIIETSCQTSDGIEDLRKAIYEQVASLKEVYDLLPLSWFEVKEQLEAMTEDFITYNRYLGICYEHKIPEEKNQEQLIDLLHRLGLVLNFREHPILQNTNVLKPDWATEGIYTLLSDETLKTTNKGIFTIADLSRILDPERYPTDKHRYLIELMKEFELCFDLVLCQP